MNLSYARLFAVLAAVMTLGFVPGPPTIVGAQEKPPAEQARPLVPLRVTVVITRLLGEKKLSNLPFTLTVNTTQRTNLRMGVEVPVPSTTLSEKVTVPSYQMRRVGTMIDCGAGPLQDDGRVALSLTIDDSQVSIENRPDSGAMRGLPRVQNFTSTATLTLRDGQTMQYTAATDSVTGEVVRVEATLNIVK